MKNVYQFYTIIDYDNKIVEVSDIVKYDTTKANPQLKEIMKIFWDKKVKDYKIYQYCDKEKLETIRQLRINKQKRAE